MDLHKKGVTWEVSGGDEATVLVLGLPQGGQTVQAILRPSRGVPRGTALEKANDFVDCGLLVLVGPSAFERKI